MQHDPTTDSEREGVTKFSADHLARSLDVQRFGERGAALIAWREILVRLGLVGQDEARYDGAGFGNVSARIGPFPGRRGRRAFVITGTQTGGRRCMNLDAFCVVSAYDIDRNHVDSYGPVRPSSESMTHGAIYDLGPHIRFVLHAHCPVIWRQARALKLPTTANDVPYGTSEMAREVERLNRESRLSDTRILAMGGHEDGIVVFGRSVEEAGEVLLRALGRAYMKVCTEAGQLCTPR